MILDIYRDKQFFYDAFEYFCFKSCYLNVLRYYKVKNPEFYIDYSLDWTFLKDENDKWGYNFHIGDINDNLISPFEKQIVSVNKQMKSTEEIWKSNKEKLKQGIPVVVTVDVFYLHYTPYFHKKHSIHSLILAGYEEAKEKVYVIDWYPSWYYKGEMSRNELDVARNSTNESDGILSGIPINYTSSTINQWEIKHEELQLIKYGIEDNLHKFYQVNTDRKVSIQGKVKGYQALKEITIVFENNMSLEDMERIKFLENTYEKLYFVPSRKKLFCWFLGRVEEEYPMISVGGVKEKLTLTMNSWKTLLSLIIKCTMRNTDFDYEKVLLRLERILLEEKQFYYSLYELNQRVNLMF